MGEIFEEKNIKPMLIGESSEPFDSMDYIYELKLDGERCIAYLDPETGTELRNKRNMKMLPKVPELSDIHKQVKSRCILDGELAVVVNGKPDFFEIQRRSLTSNEFKIRLQSQKYPASFIAFDILYHHNDQDVTSLPLMERKAMLQDTISEGQNLTVSRYIEEKGIDFYNLTKQQGLEGIVAKKKDSRYYLDKRTKDWKKIKYLLDDDFVICGYIQKDVGITSIVLGQYSNDELIYKGHVTLGVSSEDYRTMQKAPKIDSPPFFSVPNGNDTAVWLEPILACKVKYMMKTAGGGMRQPVFAGIRFDKNARECIDNI